MLTNGQVLQGNYRIVDQLGHGGMGAVYSAEHTRLAGRRFAIKENIPEPGADPHTVAELRNQFYVEAKTLAALDHPNLPKVSDYFTVGDNEYLVMDFVEGENLQQIFDRHVQQFRTPLPEKSVLGWADQVLNALAYLHGQRPSPIVHRDIKPGNIILTPDGVVKLVDFGLVKLMGHGGQDTALALRGLGTPDYTALEQYPGSQSHTDARTDIYGLGATLYHLLTGAPPANVRDRLLNPKVLEKPRRINPSLSAHTEAVMLKAIEVHPSQRFQSAGQMRTALGGKTARTDKPVRQHRWTVPVAMLAVLALLVAAGWTWRTGSFLPPPDGSPASGPVATIVASTSTVDMPPAPPFAEVATTVASPAQSPTDIPTTFKVTPASADTATPTNTPEPTSTPVPTDAPTPSPTATPVVPRAVAIGETNLRAGPGVDYPVVGTLPAGASAEITGKNQAGTWLQLVNQTGSDAWIIANRVETTGPVDGVAVVAASPTPTPAAPPTPAQPGLVTDFESGLAWRIGDQNYGRLAPSRDQAMVGSSSGRLSYDFPAVTANFVVFLAPSPIGMSGQPTGISAWVYGDRSGHFLNAWVQDSAGEVRSYTFGQVTHNGWQQMTAWFDDSRPWPTGHISGSDNGRLDYPVRLYALVLDAVPDGVASKGTIYLDDLRTELNAAPPSVGTPAVGATPAQPAPTPTTESVTPAVLSGRILYTSDGNVVALDVASGNVLTIFRSGRQPDIRADGRVVVNGVGGGKENLFTINSDGTGEMMTSRNPEDSYPHWSPSGQSAVFHSTLQGDGRERIYIQWDMTYSAVPALLKARNTDVYGRHATWLQNWRIAFTGCNYWASGSNCGIWTVDSNGNNPLQLTQRTDDRSTDSHGDTLLFSSRATGNWEVFAVSVNGGSPRNLTNSPSQDLGATFSTDGNSIAFMSDRDGRWGIWVMNVDGSNPRKLLTVANGFGSDWENERLAWR